MIVISSIRFIPLHKKYSNHSHCLAGRDCIPMHLHSDSLRLPPGLGIASLKGESCNEGLKLTQFGTDSHLILMGWLSSASLRTPGSTGSKICKQKQESDWELRFKWRTDWGFWNQPRKPRSQSCEIPKAGRRRFNYMIDTVSKKAQKPQWLWGQKHYLKGKMKTYWRGTWDLCFRETSQCPLSLRITKQQKKGSLLLA